MSSLTRSFLMHSLGRSAADRGDAAILFTGDAASATLEDLLRFKPAGASIYRMSDDAGRPRAVDPLDAGHRLQRDVIDIPGEVAGSADLPKLEEVVQWASARVTGSLHDVITAYGNAVHALGGRPPVPVKAADEFARIAKRARVDLLVVEGCDWTAPAIVAAFAGSGAVLLEPPSKSFGAQRAYGDLLCDPRYREVDTATSNDWRLFRLRETIDLDLPIHFFTIVLNGEPFIRYHEHAFSKLAFSWHWHIVEGVAALVKDTAWSVQGGGTIRDDVHDAGRSNDGTSIYLDELKRRFPHNITIYRKALGDFWDGKHEMVNAPLPRIKEECLLWQVDSDELWTAEQITTMRTMFIADQSRTAAAFWCNYYVGPDYGISTRYNYAQNPRQEWLRLWRFRPGMNWQKHEPPVLMEEDTDTGAWIDAGQINRFTHGETEAVGAVFDHFAYASESQAAFKESYYGYTGAVSKWRRLQQAGPGPHFLRSFFDWVHDDTLFDTVDRLGWKPLALRDATSGDWRFHDPLDDDHVPARPGNPGSWWTPCSSNSGRAASHGSG